MRISDYFGISGYVAKRNWKSLIVITLALISVIVIMILAVLIEYNYYSYAMAREEEYYRQNGGKLSFDLEINNAEDYDRSIAILAPHVINNIEGDWTAIVDTPLRVDIGGSSKTLAITIDKDSKESDKGKLFLSVKDKMMAEMNLRRKINIGDSVPTTIRIDNSNGNQVSVEFIFAGIKEESSLDIFAVKGEYMSYCNGFSAGFSIYFPSTVSKNDLNKSINQIIKELPKELNIIEIYNSLDTKEQYYGISILVFITLAFIVILGMISLSIIGSYLYMQIVKDGALFAVLRTSGMTKTKLAVVEFIPLVAVVIIATVVAGLIALSFQNVISDLIRMIFLESDTGQTIAIVSKYPVWIPFVCGGAMLTMLVLNIPKFAKKFRANRMLKILRERDV